MTDDQHPTTAPTASSRHLVSSAIWTLVVPAVVTAGAGVTLLAWRPELPDPVAVHWGPGGVDGTASLDTQVLALALPVAIISALAFAFCVARHRPAMARRFANATATWTATFLAGVVLATTSVQRGLSDARLASDIDGPLAVAFAVACLVGAASAVLTPADEPAPATSPVPADAPRLPLADGEHAAWHRQVRAGSPVAIGLAVIAFCTVIGMATGQWLFPTALGIALGALLLTFLRWTVTVDRSGLTARSGLPGPRLHVPLDEVERAEVVHLDPLREFGGWGLRTGLDGRTGVVLRTGDALQVHRTGGRVVVVTTPDAATGAALLNTLAARAR